jgi:predicted GIY-YIG superfamily endonuclease
MDPTSNPYIRSAADEATHTQEPAALVTMRHQVSQALGAGDRYLVYLLAFARRADFYVGVARDLRAIYAVCSANHCQQDALYGRRQAKPLRLVWLEGFASEADALRRCHTLRALPHAWQRRVVDAFNPEWIDLDHAVTGFPFTLCVHEHGAVPFVDAE